MGGFGTPNSADWYKEHLVVTVGGFTIETDNQLIANNFLENGQCNNFNSATFKQIGTRS